MGSASSRPPGNASRSARAAAFSWDDENETKREGRSCAPLPKSYWKPQNRFAVRHHIGCMMLHGKCTEDGLGRRRISELLLRSTETSSHCPPSSGCSGLVDLVRSATLTEDLRSRDEATATRCHGDQDVQKLIVKAGSLMGSLGSVISFQCVFFCGSLDFSCNIE